VQVPESRRSSASDVVVRPDPAEGGFSTLMVRNIPVRYTQDMLLKEWPNHGTYDFLYLPICIDRKRNASFCFINFVTEAHATAFQAKWQKQRLDHYSARKPLDISAADVQGRDQNLLQIMRNKTFRIKNLHFQPAIFDGLERISMETFLANHDIKGLKMKANPKSEDARGGEGALEGRNLLESSAFDARGNDDNGGGNSHHHHHHPNHPEDNYNDNNNNYYYGDASNLRQGGAHTAAGCYGFNAGPDAENGQPAAGLPLAAH